MKLKIYSLRMGHSALLLALVLTWLTPGPTEAAPMRCEYVLSPTLQQSLDKTIGKLAEIRGEIFSSKTEKEQNPRGMIQFGFESEYTIDSISKLLNFYGPTHYQNGNQAAWLAMPIQQRVEQVAADVRSRAHLRQESGLVLLDRETHAFLPETLFLDDNTNLEIILKPVSKIENWHREMKYINSQFGLGSMQTMVSTTKRAFYANGIEGKLGYFTFTADMDALLKLQAGFRRYQENPQKDVARSFLHPSLGPFSRIRQQKLREYLQAGYLDHLERRTGEESRLNKSALRDVAMREDSFKYAGSTTFRPDIGGQTRVSVEVRDAHISETDLSVRVQRAIALMRGADRGFKVFSSIPSFDSVKLFESFSPEMQGFLRQVVTAKTQSADPLTASEIISLEVFRNFSFPLRDWKPYLRLMEHEFLTNTVLKSQQDYHSQLEQIKRRFESGELDRTKALRELQGALVTFANNSGLPTAFESFYQSRLTSNTDEPQ